MTGRSRELLLEVLLLGVRYTASEIAWVKRELSKYPDAAGIGDLLKPLRPQAPTKTDTRQPANEEGELAVKIRAFTSDLLRGRSTRDRQRILGVARRLGIPTAPGSAGDIVEKIRSKLQEMEPADAAAVLRVYTSSSGSADKDYVGLANYLIRKPDS